MGISLDLSGCAMVVGSGLVVDTGGLEGAVLDVQAVKKSANSDWRCMLVGASVYQNHSTSASVISCFSKFELDLRNLSKWNQLRKTRRANCANCRKSHC
ncbi:MAG TPA: hypothetical protein PK156_23915, partial [Polyangium sp.]|nr:hypothetical protein [Polyangium sp.]